MWSPIYLKIENLFAHNNSIYNFTQGQCTVVFGENRDDDDTDNNGAGKSTLFEGIAIALTGKSLRDIDKEVFINRKANNCRIELYLENKTLNNTLKIIRCFYRGSKSGKVELWEDGKLNNQLVSVLESNKRIIELIGISREDLLRYFIISQDNRYQFFTAGDTEKKEVLNRITNAQIIIPIIEKLNVDKKDLLSKINISEVEIGKLEGKLEIYAEQVEELKLDNNEDEINTKKSEIRDLEEKISVRQGNLSVLEKKLNTLKDSDQYKRLKNIPDISKYEKKLSNLRQAINKLQDDKLESRNILNNLESDVAGVVECPNCKHEFMVKSNYDISVDEAKTLIVETKNHIETIDSAIGEYKIEIEKLNDKIREVDNQRREFRKIEEQIHQYENSINENNSYISRYKRSIDNIREEIDRLNNSDNSKQIKELKNKICEVKEQVNKKKLLLNEYRSSVEMVDYWLYYMGKQGFTTYLANKAVKVIEGITNSFLERFKSSMSVEINGYKINKDGSVRERIDVMAVYRGMYRQNFMGYSGGERGRIYLASILGIQHLINLSSGGRGLDLLLLDESLGALDSRGVVNICNILNNLGITILMITQNVSNDVNIANKVLIVKENEISRIV